MESPLPDRTPREKSPPEQALPASAPAVHDDSLFAQRSFMHLWVARLLGTAGNQILMLALAWQMYELTGSAWDLGLVGLLQFLPALPLLLPVGHAIDRYHRGRLLALCLACQVGIAAALLLAEVSGQLTRGTLLAVSVAIGVMRAIQMPTQQALVPLLVPPALLARAMAFSSAGIQAAIIGGPALGGVLFVAGAKTVYACCVLLFVLSTVLVALGVRYRHEAVTQSASLESLLAGLRFVFAHKVVLGAISLDLFAVLLGGATALLPMFAKDVLDVGATGLGLLRAAPAVGALAMSIVLTRWAIRRHTGPLLLGSVAFYGLTMLVFGWSTAFWLSMAALALGGAADMVSVVIRQTLVQLDTPDAMRGRVSAVNAVFIGASNQLGEFRAGGVAEYLGAVGSVLLGGIGTCLVAALWWRLFPALARRDALAAPEAAEVPAP
ncbi:MAG: MFS transporter [Burkholderiales bacterium]|nr:MFS transporter [Burkholderiales bacterium]